MQHIFFQHYVVTTLCVSIFASTLLLVPGQTAAATTVTNSVSVSASGGTSEASVTTVVNGETVESWATSTKDDISYDSAYTTAAPAAANTTVTTDAQSSTADLAAFQTLLERLEVLIQLYASLHHS